MLTERERFILQYLLGKLNEYAEVVAGAQVTVPEENIKEMQEARVRNLSNQDRQEIISEIKQELMIMIFLNKDYSTFGQIISQLEVVMALEIMW